MKILIISQYFWPENFRVNDLVDELLNREHTVTILTGLPNYPEGEIYQDYKNNKTQYGYYKAAQIIRIPIIPRGKTNLLLFLNYLSFIFFASIIGLLKLRKKDFDVIFVFQVSPITVALPAILIKKLKRIPLTMWVLDLWPNTLIAVNVVNSRWLIYLVGKMVSFIYLHCDLILAQSKSFYKEIEKYCKDIEKIKYFPNWSEELFNSNVVLEAPEIIIDSSFFNIVFAGNIGDAQDFPSILNAVELLKNDATIKWYIVGEGRKLEWLSNEIKFRKLKNHIFLLGKYPLERMPSFYKAANALLVTLKDNPIFDLTIPGKIQSYLLSNKPILAMLNGEGARVITDSGAGFVSNSGDFKGLANHVVKLKNLSLGEYSKIANSGINYSNQEFNRKELISKLERIFIELKKKT